jgi:hypothetical protein
MARFYFDYRDGEIARDDEGLDLSSLAEAQAQATTALGEAARDMLASGVGGDGKISIEVLDAERTPLFKVAIRFEARSLA